MAVGVGLGELSAGGRRVDARARLVLFDIFEFRTNLAGYGRLCDAADVAYYRDMVTIIRDRIQSMIKKDMTLEQIKAAKPTMDYDGIYGATTGIWTTDMFIDAVYKSLVNQKK